MLGHLFTALAFIFGRIQAVATVSRSDEKARPLFCHQNRVANTVQARAVIARRGSCSKGRHVIYSERAWLKPRCGTSSQVIPTINTKVDPLHCEGRSVNYVCLCLGLAVSFRNWQTVDAVLASDAETWRETFFGQHSVLHADCATVLTRLFEVSAEPRSIRESRIETFYNREVS